MAGKIGLTFKDSKVKPVHRWYPYVEGFSATWIAEMMDLYCNPEMRVYDPFGGSGTMNLEASKAGIKNYYSEMNPFMRFILDTKVNVVKKVQDNRDYYLEIMNEVKDYIRSDAFNEECRREFSDDKYRLMLEKDYFVDDDLRILRAIYELSEKSYYPDEIGKLIRCAAACITVDTSNMTRRSDLRRRRNNEYLTRVVDVKSQFLDKWDQFICDIEQCERLKEPAIYVADDARSKNGNCKELFDFVITSPPYINGTNYIRNTSLELLLTGEAKNEASLKCLKEKTVCGGISDATASRMEDLLQFPFVETVAKRLDENAKDSRIPLMVRCYFSDMYKVFESVYYYMKTGAKFALDIGDSIFYGVHVPTDELLCNIAELVGFKVLSQEQIAERFSRDKTKLKQVLIVFEK